MSEKDFVMKRVHNSSNNMNDNAINLSYIIITRIKCHSIRLKTEFFMR
jgi:hypothetical protein